MMFVTLVLLVTTCIADVVYVRQTITCLSSESVQYANTKLSKQSLATMTAITTTMLINDMTAAKKTEHLGSSYNYQSDAE